MYLAIYTLNMTVGKKLYIEFNLLLYNFIDKYNWIKLGNFSWSTIYKLRETHVL